MRGGAPSSLHNAAKWPCSIIERDPSKQLVLFAGAHRRRVLAAQQISELKTGGSNWPDLLIRIVIWFYGDLGSVSRKMTNRSPQGVTVRA